MSREAFIVSARRTPIGRYGGGLSSVPAVELGRVAVAAALEDSGVDPDRVDQLILGMARQAGNGPNPVFTLSWPVAVSVASVRPWNDCRMVTISYFPLSLPQSRASLISPSLASAPELQKKHFAPGSSDRAESFLASCGCFSL